MKIISDGTVIGTKVYTDNGDVISNIKNIKFEIGVDIEPSLTVTLNTGYIDSYVSDDHVKIKAE